MQGNICVFSNHANPAVAGPYQQVLDKMGQLLNFIEPQEAGSPFDGVESPQDSVDLLHVVGVNFQSQDRSLRICEPITRFGDEVPDQFRVGIQRRNKLRRDTLRGRGFALARLIGWPCIRAVQAKQ